MIDLELALSDLAEHLDHPDGSDLGNAVRRRISGSAFARPRTRPARRVRTLVAFAATIAVVAAAIVTLGPARHAIADWLGIGAVEVRHSSQPLPPATGAHPVPGTPSSTPKPNPRVAGQLAAARAAVSFTITTPRGSAPLAGVALDSRVPGGLVVLRYPGFTLVEIATGATNRPIVRKLLGPGVHTDDVTVAGAPGLWIRGAHDIGFLDRNGNPETDTIRRSGPVLLWVRTGVTYRIEGFARLADAQAVARSVR